MFLVSFTRPHLLLNLGACGVSKRAKGSGRGWERYVLSTWDFWCAHSLVGGSSRLGEGPRGPWEVLLPPGANNRRDTFLYFSSFLSFPFPFPSHWGLSWETETVPSSCTMNGWVDPHSLPSLSTFAARKVMPAHCQTGCHLLFCHCLCCSQLPCHFHVSAKSSMF